MNIQLSKTPIGLDGVPAAETVLSHVDGERGELIIAGERIGELARKTGFEGVTARLCSGGTLRSAPDANAPLPGCRSCWELRGACRSSTPSARRSRGFAPRQGYSMKPPSSARFR